MHGYKQEKELDMTSREEETTSYSYELDRLVGHGTLPDALWFLYPNMDGQERDMLCSFVDRLSRFTTCDDEGYAFITGSAAKRIIGGTPAGWETINMLAQQFLDKPAHQGNDILVRLAHGGTKDLDIRFSVLDGRTFEGVVEELTREDVHCGRYTVRYVKFGGNKFATIQFPSGFSLDLGEIWNSLSANYTNCRISSLFPVSEFVTCVSIQKGLELMAYSGLSDDQYFMSDEVFSSYYGMVDLSQALIATERSLLNHFWWKRGQRYTPNRREPMRSTVLRTGQCEEFWERVKRDFSGRETLFDARRLEIAAGFVLYLLCDPNRFLEDMKRYHLLQFLPLGQAIANATLVYDHESYGQQFSLGTLRAEDSGLSLLAGALGIPPLELITELYPEYHSP
jgi:hypothetical protein